ncbi:Hypothetical_protein [Hexamita inflata]|uniref:Hypothetical_protein n=1 Tax=Hexamita inflata TaxID=28002 RepID=A0AA86U1Y0_9EUKA|nr:Hypothetical protein HINF_LOCUS24869 [Hexamita inflata]
MTFLRSQVTVRTLYTLIQEGYLHEGLFFYLLTPLFIGLESDGKNHQKYIREKLNVMKLFAQRAVQLVTDNEVSSLGRGKLSYELIEFIEDHGLQTFIPLQANIPSNRVIATKSDKNSQKLTKLARMIVKNSKYGFRNSREKE